MAPPNQNNQVYLAQSSAISSTQNRNPSQGISGTSLYSRLRIFLILTIASGATSVSSIPEAKHRKFTTTRLLGSYEKPWLQDGSYKARERMEKGILLLCTCVGIALAIIICGAQWKTVVVVDVRFLYKV
jgi:hypothetical protein